MKRILLGVLLALPFAFSSFQSEASAAPIVRRNVQKTVVIRRKPVVRYQRKLIPARYETVRRGNKLIRVRIPARYVNVRV